MRSPKPAILFAAFSILSFACSACSRAGYGPPGDHSETDTESDAGFDAEPDAGADAGSDDGAEADADANQTVELKLTASDAQASDYFGSSVAISGDLAIVGAWGESGGVGDSKPEAGAAYIYQKAAGQWVEMQKLTASDAEAYDWFGGPVAISGDVAIVGAEGEDGGNGDPKSRAGAAYIFQLVSGQWVQKQKLTASDAEADDRFGWSVAISGDMAIVGAVHGDAEGGNPVTDAGAAYIFQLESGQWVEMQKLTASDAQAGDWFGVSVAITEDVANGYLAIVGADLPDGEVENPITDAEAATIFHLESGQWVEMQKLTASDAQAHDSFGSSVAISGGVAIVGAYKEDGDPGDPKTDAGAAYIFQLELGQWNQKQKLSAPDAQASDAFGISIALSGNTAIVGAWGADGGSGNLVTDAGAAYIFQFSSGQWVETQRLSDSDAQSEEQFGIFVATSGSVAIVGASLRDSGAPNPKTDAGAAYIYAF